MEQLRIIPLTPETKPTFYRLVEEYLPDSAPVQLKEYGAPSVSLGSAGGYVEKFYIDCGYTPTEYKVWENGASVVEKRFDTIEDYYTYSRKNEDGFVVMCKKI